MVKGHVGAAIHTAFTAFLCLSVVLFSIIQIRYGAAVIGLVPLRHANAYEPRFDNAQMRDIGMVTIEAQYCSEVVSAADPMNSSGRTSTRLSFDDSWFSRDSRAYNHELATACTVLSAICNSESQFYGGVEGAVPYAERALGALGFTDIRSDSYALRSNLFDQMASLFVGPLDVSAYIFASKTLAGKGSVSDETLIFVGIRGSYGVEWLSNLRLFGDGGEASDHPGFSSAKQKIIQALEKYTQEIGADPTHTKILVTGHSRGGALANLLAADLVSHETSEHPIAQANNVFAYTFATPGTTKAADCGSSTYAGIFNIANPSDIVTQFPLPTWGYGRYGTTVLLPSPKDSDFPIIYSAMLVDYKNNTGCSNPSTIHDLIRLDGLDEGAAETAPTIECVWKPETLHALTETMSDIDMAMMLSIHYPDTYIAWMQSIDPHRIGFG